jgi:hypothetical protein
MARQFRLSCSYSVCRLGGKHAFESGIKTVHRAYWIIGGHVDRGVFAGGLFQHVSGNPEPISAL